jgi:hypothetical protein
MNFLSDLAKRVAGSFWAAVFDEYIEAGLSCFEACVVLAEQTRRDFGEGPGKRTIRKRRSTARRPARAKDSAASSAVHAEFAKIVDRAGW